MSRPVVVNTVVVRSSDNWLADSLLRRLVLRISAAVRRLHRRYEGRRRCAIETPTAAVYVR